MKNKKELETQWKDLRPRLESYVITTVKNKDDAEDIMQEVFIKAYNSIYTLKDDSKLNQWLFSIARNEINTFFNNQKKLRLQIPQNEAEDVLPISTIIDACAEPFLNALPQKYSEALKLVFIEKLSQKELAKRLNISYSGAKSRVQRGKLKLKELIEACCAIKHDSYGNIIDYTRKKDGFCPIPVSCA